MCVPVNGTIVYPTSTVLKKRSPILFLHSPFSYSSHVYRVHFLQGAGLKTLLIRWGVCAAFPSLVLLSAVWRLPWAVWVSPRIPSLFYFSSLSGSISSLNHLPCTRDALLNKTIWENSVPGVVMSPRRPFDGSGATFLIKCCWKPFVLSFNFRDCTEFLVHWAATSWA